ncbi:hypothetical protein PoB_004773300 [Plakobranchus ocellatus]|uniref:Ras-GAP domain-containing protein n=1 Tax=Plakobranchus ocellatus TaxID=259542 RepID=A0AAV4BQ34_9GAST|nr:hypothetical protein PoB_004773300 [Plakobranchus ocellatus]
MAWRSGNGELFQKNSKFESFLKRTISDEAFERVRAYESCVVISERENKAFKFVVLTDEKIYLTENPPKSLQEVVHLKDVTSVELVNEFPDFLVGQERTNTQHIAVTYTTSEPRRRSLRRSKRSPRGSQTELNGDRSNASTPLGYSSSVDSSSVFPDDQGYLTQSSSSLTQSRPTSRGSIKASMQAKKKKKGLGLNDSWDHDSILRSLQEIEEDTLEDIEEDRLSVIKSQGPSRTGSSVHRTAGSRKGSSYHRELPAVPVPGGGAGAGDAVSVRSLSQQSVRPLPPMPKTGAFETVVVQPGVPISASSSAALYPSKAGGGKAVVAVQGEEDEEEEASSRGCRRFFSCCGGQKNQVAPIYKNSSIKKGKSDLINQEDTTSEGPVASLQNGNPNNSFGGSQLSGQFGGVGFASFNQPPSRGSSMRGSRSNTPIIEPERNLNELNVSSSDLGRSNSLQGLSSLSVDGLGERRKCVLNLYILNLTSPLLMFIRSAWNNFIIRSTLALEPEQISISTVTEILSAKNREKLERTYSHLKRDLFHPNLSMEEQYVLIDRLHSTTRSSPTLKKLFWKNPDMFSFLVSQLHKYLPHSQTSLDTEEGKAQRADEIEFTILILSTINLMLRETEVLPSRFQTVTLEGGKLVTDLLKILMCQPELPYRPLTLSKHWSDPLAGNKKTEKQKNLNEELARLKTDYTRTAISATFELFLVAKQAHADALPILTISGMVDLFNEKKAMEKFVDRLLSQVMELVSLSRFDLLTPTQAMIAFQMFSLLQTFLEYSKTIVNHIRNNYYEEFKYFIQAPAVSRKLPVQYPITANTISLIDQVVVRVLGSHSVRGSKYQ